MAGAKAEANTETGDAAAAAGSGGGSSFSEQRLVEKLSKLNNSAASIQSILFRGFILAR
jgi:regulator of Ty1 transposition protein 103